MEKKSQGRTTGKIEEEVKAADYTLLQRAIDYCESRPFRNALKDFREQHAAAFYSTNETSECALVHTEIFQEYVSLIDKKMDFFLSKEGATAEQFSKQCQEVLSGSFTALFEENEHAWFVDLLLSWGEYKHFRRVMIAATAGSTMGGAIVSASAAFASEGKSAGK